MFFDYFAGGIEILWTVTGSRHDFYIQKYGAQAVEEKPAEQRGKYLQPELYGIPASMNVHYLPEKNPDTKVKK